MRRFDVRLLMLLLFIVCFPYPSDALDGSLEKDVEGRLEESRQIIGKAIEKLASGVPASSEINKLKTIAKSLRTSHLLLDTRYRKLDEDVKVLSAKAQGRQKNMSEGYRRALEEYLSLVNGLPPEGKISQTQLENLAAFLDKNLHKKKRPLLGTLPYEHLNYPATQPSTDPAIKPAYKGGNKVVSPADTDETEEAPISEEIADLAESLNWNPVSIYEYVKNNIETEWYWGCMKGAEDTLHQKSGNDCDQASLFIALLRASGFPSRYVRGTIEFFVGGRDGVPIEKVKNLTGIDNPWKIAEFFQKSGIPFNPIISGGTISNFQIEHIWVESQIPYANYRGAVIDEQGKTWLGLDTSIKVKDYQYSSPLDILKEFLLSNIRDDYLGAIQTQTPLEFMKTKIGDYLTQSHPDKTYNALLLTKTLPPEVMNILPASMQFEQKNITHEYTAIPDELKHKVKFTATDTNNNELFTITMDTMNLSNRQIALSYEPETVDDQQIIDSYGGLDNTPSYLVRLRPILKVDGEMAVAGKAGLPMGADHNLTIELISPNGSEKITKTYIAGDLSAIAVVFGKVVKPEQIPLEQKDAERLLYEEAISHIDRWNQAEEELGSLMLLNLTRPTPTVATVGGVIDVTYVLDTPQSYEWKGVYVDANLRAIEVTPSYSPLTQGGDEERKKTFMQLSALQGSILENRIFEDDFQVDSISTAKLLEIANSNQTPLLTIDKTNISTILPTLPVDDNIKEDITNSVNQNLTITIPNQQMTYKDWTGIGYVKENLGTAESGWLLSGMIAGGMTAVSPDKWTNQSIRDKLGRPYKSEIKVLVITSPQNGTVVFAPFVTVTGTVLGSTEVTVNGVAATVEGTTFTVSVPLTHGSNTITAVTTNAMGARMTDQVSVIYKLPVGIFITFPYDGANLSVTPIDVEGIVSDPSATVDVNRTKGVVSADGRFIAKGISLVQGANQLAAKGVNSDGSAGSQTITVNYQTTPAPTINITITYPQNNAIINRPSTMVRGTVTSDAQEISIKVNGQVAEIYGNQFVVNNVPLTNGANIVVANALDSNGAVARAEVSVTADSTQPSVTLSANITSGIPPMTTYFSVSTNIPHPIVSYEMDFLGNGVIDYTGDTFEDITYTYTTEGIYYPTVTVTDDQGNTYTDSIAITVQNKDTIDALLKTKWGEMKWKLNGGDIEAALAYYSDIVRQNYKAAFTALYSQLNIIFGYPERLNLIEVIEQQAKYEYIVSEPDGVYSYPLIFERDSNGTWKILQY